MLWKKIAWGSLGGLVALTCVALLGNLLYSWYQQEAFRREHAQYSAEVEPKLAELALSKARPYLPKDKYNTFRDRLDRRDRNGFMDPYGTYDSYASIVDDITSEVEWWAKDKLQGEGYYGFRHEEWKAAVAQLEREEPGFVQVRDLDSLMTGLWWSKYHDDWKEFQEDRVEFAECKQRIDALLASKD